MQNDFMNVNREEFVQLLEQNAMKFEFEKLDGTMRKMIATRRLSQVPADQHPKEDYVPSTIGPVAVFDLEVCGWRNVNADKLVSLVVQND